MTTPSITYNGAVEPLIEPTPRILTFPTEPGSPVADATRTPAIFPEKALSKDSLDPEVIWSALIDVAEPVNDDSWQYHTPQPSLHPAAPHPTSSPLSRSA